MTPTPSYQWPSFALREVLPSLFAGGLIGVLVIFVEVSFAALIFSGELTSFVAQGIGIHLFGALVFGVVVALTNSVVSTVALPQDAPVAILAVVATAMVGQLSAATPEQTFATVVAAIMLSTILAGIFFWLMGQFNLGRLVRFIPYPVVGGFLAGAGWLLVVGAIGVMTDAPLDLALFQPGVLIRWLPGLLFAGVLWVLLRRYTHFLLMPSLLLAGIGLFYLTYFLSTDSLSTAASQGWLLGPFPERGLWQPVTGLVLTQADWSVVFGNAVNLSTILLIGAISLLLNASGLEITIREDVDLNRELRSAGIANILAGLGGSPAGYQALSLSALGYRLGARSRLVGVFSAALAGFALFFGATLLSVFPKLIAGGFLLFLGLSFLVEWVFDSWFKLPKLDYLLIWVILVVIAVVGFLEGVTVGILVAVIFFAVNYSRIDVVRHVVTGADYQSHVTRPRLYQQLLQQRGNRLYIQELQGFIFFGTAYRFVEQIEARIGDPDLPALRFLLLDFRLVTGVDSSAALSFSRLKQLLEGQQIQLVLTHLSDEIQAQLGFEDENPEAWRVFPDLDQGVAWCEARMIDVFTGVGLVARPKTLLQHLDEILPQTVEEETDWLDYLKPGAKPKVSSHATKFMPYLERIKADVGQCLMREGEEVKGLYFIEEGQVTAQTHAESGLWTLEAGTVFGEVDLYSQQQASATVTANHPSVLFYLSAENLERLETEEPEIAIAFHRFIAGILGRKVVQTSHTVRALRR